MIQLATTGIPRPWVVCDYCMFDRRDLGISYIYQCEECAPTARVCEVCSLLQVRTSSAGSNSSVCTDSEGDAPIPTFCYLGGIMLGYSHWVTNKKLIGNYMHNNAGGKTGRTGAVGHELGDVAGVACPAARPQPGKKRQSAASYPRPTQPHSHSIFPHSLPNTGSHGC